MLAGLVETFGEGPAAILLLIGGAACCALPLWTFRARGAWVTREARVEEIAARRTLGSSTWAVLVSYDAPDHGPVRATVPVNIARRPVAPGERIAVLTHPVHPGRAVLGRWEGAGTPVMAGLLLLLGAFVIVAR
jgi:hypothetical protein